MSARAWSRAALAYCANVHPGADLDALLGNLAGPITGVRRRRGLSRMAMGLWIAAPAARLLAGDEGRMAAFRDALDRAGLDLLTLNGFPQGDFHGPRVKTEVYRPDWGDPRRLAYTLDLARILAACLPADADRGSLSTVPLGYAPDWDPGRQARAQDHLLDLLEALDQIHQEGGRLIQVGLEMEPGCVLERTPQLLSFFQGHLQPAAEARGLTAALGRHLGVCFDICHQAVMFESPAEALEALQEAGIPIVKIQVSNALELRDPARHPPPARLAAYAEPRYLHQVRCRRPDGRLWAHEDLPAALADPSAPHEGPWRVHFHVPIHRTRLQQEGLATTAGAIAEVLDCLASRSGLHPHLEVETYTWEVLPESLRPAGPNELEAGLAEELVWLEGALAARGLLS